jgi:membrane-bound metal-dependent hydrolase YbcI (DUF457 family)
MLIFAHLFAGAILGVALCWFLKDNRVIPLCIAASVIPDFIDKPLGYILLPQTLDSGRTFFHALIAIAIIAALAFLVWRFKKSRLVFFVAIAVLLHQLSDGMWHEPVTWFYPVLGPFQPYHYINYFGTYFWIEISSVSEWVFLCATLLVLSLGNTGSITLPVPPTVSRGRLAARSMVLILLAILCLYSLWSGIMNIGNVMAPYNTPENDLIIGTVALAGFCTLVASRHVAALPGGLKK